MSLSFRLTLRFAALIVAGMVATALAPLVVHAQATATLAAASASGARAYGANTTGANTAGANTTGANTTSADDTGARTLTWTRAIATRPLVRGDTLRADDFALRDTSVARLPFGADTTTPRAGWLIQRPIAAGEWLRAPAVIARPAVTAGRTVHAIWSDGSVQLAVSAVALNSAPVGGPVAVRVGRTRRLDGIAVAPDSVRLR